MNVESSIPERFAEQAARRPHETAIAGTSWQPTFAELDSASNALAARIAERSDGQPGRVAVLLRHDAPLIAAMLAALRSGGTAVVLDPRWPPERLARIRDELGTSSILTDAAHRDLALSAGFSRSCLVEVPERPESGSIGSHAISTRPDDLAFLIHTSGSTGRA
ncbi:MAG TPA: AMP-binding protein, partial [Solirubrobacterales bacterium]|nr:AMP-binding protein [Solirubrobacterales bacterium]